jgi:hypothetical protein
VFAYSIAEKWGAKSQIVNVRASNPTMGTASRNPNDYKKLETI